MADHDVAGLAGIAATVIGAVVWLLRLEGRVNTHEVLQARLAADIQYIRQRIDDVLNGRHRE